MGQIFNIFVLYFYENSVEVWGKYYTFSRYTSTAVEVWTHISVEQKNSS
jgi:hypothetical protein